MSTIINLPVQWVLLSGIVSEVPSNFTIETDTVPVSVESIKQEKDQITIEVKLSPPLIPAIQKRTLIYDQNTLSPHKAAFIGWVFILFDDDKNKAKKFLEKAISDGIESCIPYYLLLKANLIDEDNSFPIVRATKMPDTFPELFYQLYLYMRNKNMLKAIGFLERGLKKFSHDINLVVNYGIYLEKESKYEELLKILQESEPINSSSSPRWVNPERYHSLYFKGYLKLGRFVEAETFLDNSSGKMRIATINFCKGLLYLEKQNYEKAIEFFEETIKKEDITEELTEAASYYLLNYYLQKNDIKKIENIIPRLKPENEKDYLIPGIDYHYDEITEKTLKGVIENQSIDELTKAKAKGFLAYLIKQKKLSELANMSENKCFRKLTSQELEYLNSALKLTGECLEYESKNKFYKDLDTDLSSYKNTSDEIVNSNFTKIVTKSDKEQHTVSDVISNENDIEKLPHSIVKFPTPIGTIWQDMEIIMIDDTTLRIKIKEIKQFHRLTFSEMGFKDKRKGLPNEQWETLLRIAIYNGEISWKSSGEYKLQKKIERLRRILKTFFGIQDDPFFTYKKIRMYKTKFKISYPKSEDEEQRKYDEQKMFEEELQKKPFE